MFHFGSLPPRIPPRALPLSPLRAVFVLGAAAPEFIRARHPRPRIPARALPLQWIQDPISGFQSDFPDSGKKREQIRSESLFLFSGAPSSVISTEMDARASADVVSTRIFENR